jgi:SAM-dependent methyltransferase
MRKWTKHAAVPRDQPQARHANAADVYSAQMGGYDPDDAYQSKSTFFARHLQAHPRLVAYDRYLRPRLRKGERVLSVASGRCANELALVEATGCEITCSDLREPPCLAATRALFPSLQFVPLDVLRDEPPGRFDTVLSLSLIYAFDDQQLAKFFAFARRVVAPSGRLLLDLAGSPDNFLSFMLHDVFLPAEAALIAGYRSVRHRTGHRVEHTAHGYRRTLEDVAEVARSEGFVVAGMQTDGYDIDLRRGVLLNRLADTGAGLAAITWIGRRMPYTRMAELALAAGSPSPS